MVPSPVKFQESRKVKFSPRGSRLHYFVHQVGEMVIFAFLPRDRTVYYDGAPPPAISLLHSNKIGRGRRDHHQGDTGCRCRSQPSRMTGRAAVALPGPRGDRGRRGRPGALGVLRPELVGDGNAAGAVDQRLSTRLVLLTHGVRRCGKGCVRVHLVESRSRACHHVEGVATSRLGTEVEDAVLL